MHILMVTEHCCARVSKEAVALYLKHPDWRIDLLTKSGIVQVSAQYFANTYFYDDPTSLRDQLLRIRPDVAHVHNEPAWPVHVCCQVNICPVVFDVHDLDFIRYGRDDHDERMIAAAADALIVPSRAYRAALDGRATVLYSAVNSGDFRWCDSPENLMVLESHVNVSKGEFAPWLDYRDVAERFNKVLKHPLFIQSAETQHGMEYTSAIMLERTDFAGLCHRMPHFRWGLVGGGVPNVQWDSAMPNKLFEYMAWGVVPVVLWAKECAEFVKEHGIGIVLESPEDAKGKLTQTAWARCREALKKKRDQWSMERQVPVLEAVYLEAMQHWCSPYDPVATGLASDVWTEEQEPTDLAGWQKRIYEIRTLEGK